MKKTVKKSSSYRLPECQTSFSSLVADVMDWTEAEAMRLLIAIGAASIINRMEGYKPKYETQEGKRTLKKAIIEQITDLL